LANSSKEDGMMTNGNTINTGHTERTEALYDNDRIIKRVLETFSWLREGIDGCIDHTEPAIHTIEPIWSELVKLKERGIQMRLVTEITSENVGHCKKLMKIGEVRHLDGVRSNFGIADGKEYLGHTISRQDKPLSHAIISNVRGIVEAQQYLFEMLWSKAIPAIQKVKEIEEGTIPIRTKLVEDQDEIIKEIKRKNNAANKLSICTTLGGMQMSYNHLFDSYKNVVEKYKKGESKEGMRWLMNISDKEENLSLAKIFLESGIQIRHIKNIPPLSFGVTDKEVAITIEKMEGGKMSQSFLISSEPLYVSHFNSLFDELWKKGINAEERIKNIKEGVTLAELDVIESPTESVNRAINISNSTKKELSVLYSTANSFHRQVQAGLEVRLREYIKREVRVRFLIPFHEKIIQTLEELKNRYPQIEFKSLDASLQSNMAIILADRKECLLVETKDDTKDSHEQAAGISIYTDSKSIVSSYVSIFESFWRQSELFEQLKIHDKMQKEFINIAAHELRTPIQPILGLSEIVRTKVKNINQDTKELTQLLDVITRNAKRLQRLTEDILDVTKIESRSLKLNKQNLNLIGIVESVMADYKREVDNYDKKRRIKLYANYDKVNNILVEVDKVRLTQVISNLLSNAIKFTKEGEISVSIERDDNVNMVIASVRDSGSGIDTEILPRLFTKFTSKSFAGTGLGLYISKSIVEAHGGRIWAHNNTDGKGATFTFSLPINPI
jgi:two-component system, OmpR family, sensor histidine kinase VicK